MMKRKESAEFENFDRAMEQLLRVPHSEIKKKLDAEKEEKRKRKAAKKSVGAPKREDV
jgi:hypothetical protein